MSPERGQVRFGNRTLSFDVTRSVTRQTVGVTVDITGVTLIAPAQLPMTTLERIALSRATWIIGKQQRLEDLSATEHRPKTFESGESFRYLGRQYRLRYFFCDSNPTATLRGRFLEVQARDTAEARSAVAAWYKARAAERLPERVVMYSKRLGCKVPPILIRDQQQRWGSCSSKGELRFNWRIVMPPMRLVDYVVAHELCHLQEPNHSSAFWTLLRQVMHDFEDRRKTLDLCGWMYSI